MGGGGTAMNWGGGGTAMNFVKVNGEMILMEKQTLFLSFLPPF